MANYIICKCGRTINFDESQSGTKVQCKGCARFHEIPFVPTVAHDLTNPYASPDFVSSGASFSKERIESPAMGLLIVSSISVFFLVIALAFDVFLLASGTASQLPQPGPMPKEAQIIIRALWGGIMLLCNVVIIFGALSMYRLRRYELAKAAAILSVIPCLSPCCVVGIPFGLTALSRLSHPDVMRAFRS